MSRKWCVAGMAVLITILAVHMAWFAGKWPLVSKITVRSHTFGCVERISIERGGRTTRFGRLCPGEVQSKFAVITGMEDFQVAVSTSDMDHVAYCGYGQESVWRLVGNFEVVVSDSAGLSVAYKKSPESYPPSFMPCGPGREY